MKAVICAYGRTPFHFARKGRLAGVRPDILAAHLATALVQRLDLDPLLLEDLLLGCAYPEAAQGNNLARMVGLLAGLPQSVGGMTLNRLGGSSMQAVHSAAAQIEAGMGEAFLCLGVESMSMVPLGGFHLSPHPRLAQGEACIALGQTAENVAERWRVDRAAQQAFALQSHRRAANAQACGRLTEEIVPIADAEGALVQHDGCIRPQTSLEAMAALRPAFRDGGSVTAATAAPPTDGAAALLVASDTFASRQRLAPLARIRACACAGVDPAVMGIGPVPATRKALKRAGLTVADLDVVELHEAFAAQAIACARELGLDPARTNLDGGGLAIGHPLGASGARITGKAAALLQRTGGRYALATQCIAGGQGIATILERA
jgi:acetyl-CoA acyltransferase